MEWEDLSNNNLHIVDCKTCRLPARCKDKHNQNCKFFRQREAKRKARRNGWTVAELALAYPTSLNKALSALPFRVDLAFYLSKRR